MKTTLLVFALLSSPMVRAQGLDIQSQISSKQAELSALQQQSARQQAPFMFAAMTEMVKASSQCVADGVKSKKMFTRVATISKACREQAQLGAFAICAVTVAQTGDTRDLNQCTEMMKENGVWAQVWMRGLGVAGAYAGGKLASDVVIKGAIPLALSAVNREPAAPVIVNPIIVEQPEPIIIQPTEPIIIGGE